MTPSDIHRAHPLGPVLLIIGIGLLLEGDSFRAMAGGEFLRDQGLIYVTGLPTLAAGLAILNVHHVWSRDWRVAHHHIFGWLFLIGGIMRIPAMSMAQRVGEFGHRASALATLAGAIVTPRARRVSSRSWAIRTSGMWHGGGRPISVSAARSTRPASRAAPNAPRRKGRRGAPGALIGSTRSSSPKGGRA